MKSQLLLIFLPIILLISFLVGFLSLSLVDNAAVGQGNHGRHYFSLVNTRGEFFQENLLLFDSLMTHPYKGVRTSMEWANQVVHILTEAEDQWDANTLYQYGDLANSNGNYILSFMFPRTQPVPDLHQPYWEKYVPPVFQYGNYYQLGQYVLAPTNIMYRFIGTWDVVPPDPSGPDILGIIVANFWVQELIPAYNPVLLYHTEYNTEASYSIFNAQTNEVERFVGGSASIVQYGTEFYYLKRSRADTTSDPQVSLTAPTISNGQDPQSRDFWELEQSYINMIDPRIPTDGTFFTIFNSPLSPNGTTLAIRWDRLIATAPLAFPPQRLTSPYSGEYLDFEVFLSPGEGATMMNTANRFTQPNGSNAAGQFLYDEYNVLDRRWQVVRFMNA